MPLTNDPPVRLDRCETRLTHFEGERLPYFSPLENGLAITSSSTPP